ncbi:MAG: GtrA family protein, partial [Patescibacteria group bacterium]
VGLTGFIFDIGIFYLLTKHADVASWKANLLSTETAVITNYILNNFWSFAHKKVESKASAYISSFIKYNIVSSGSILIQTLGVELMKHLFGDHNIYLYKIGIIAFIIIPYSYFFFNRFIWKDKK